LWLMLMFIVFLLLVCCVTCARMRYYPTHYLVQVGELLCDKKTNGEKIWRYSLVFFNWKKSRFFPFFFLLCFILFFFFSKSIYFWVV
jgi:hypothetical protein